MRLCFSGNSTNFLRENLEQLRLGEDLWGICFVFEMLNKCYPKLVLLKTAPPVEFCLYSSSGR